MRSTFDREASSHRSVALYYPWVYLTSGAERTILELTGRSRHRWTVFTNHFDRRATFPEFASRNVVELARVSVSRSLANVMGAGLRILTQRLPLQPFDALVVVCEGLGDLVMFRSAVRPTVCICLTPLRPVFDREYRRRAMAERGVAGRWCLQAGSAAFAAIDRRAWRRYDRIFCISEESRDRAVRGRLAPVDRLELLHVGIGIEPDGCEIRFDPFFLMPGRIMWTKNLELGIRAFQRFRSASPAGPAFRLVIAGIVDEKSRPYMERLRSLIGADPQITIRIAPTDAELRELYATCRGVIFPAFNEDWGIVPLEGMAFGKPVLAVNRGGPREAMRHGVTGYLEDADVERFAARLRQFAEDLTLARRLGAAGRSRSRDYTWESFTERVDTAIDGLLEARTVGSPSRQRVLGAAVGSAPRAR